MTVKNIFHKKYSHMLSLFAFLILLGWFEYLEKTIVPKYIIHSSLDSYIPFIKEFVIPYYIWYFYIAACFLYLALTSKKEFYRFYLYIALGMSLSYVIYMIFPNAQYLRPKTIPGNDIFSIMIRNMYRIDTPTNVCPSIHVINAIGVYLGFATSHKLKNNRYIKALCLFITILICIATLFIKQHSIVDVTAGVIFSIILYLAVYFIPNLVIQKHEVLHTKDATSI